MSDSGKFDGIPGTYVFDGQRCREGYHLNMFCKSMEREENRRAFTEDPAGYLDRYPMTAEQRRLVEARDWLGMLRLGGNIYYMLKLISYDRSTLQHVGGQMTGMTVDEFREMLSEGRMGPAGLGPARKAR